MLQVRDLVEKCTCPTQFPMIRVSEGKYRIGDTKVLIFVRVSIIEIFYYSKTILIIILCAAAAVSFLLRFFAIT